jgi:DNA replication and repair protein RecF
LTLRTVRIATLRCLKQAELTLDPRRSYVYGPNGAGKTSILEALFLLSRGRSFRTRQIRRLVQHGADTLTVYGEIAGEQGTQKLGVSYREGRLDKHIGGEAAGSSAALAALLPVHILDPSIHQLVEGGPSERRRFLDWGVFHVEHDYLPTWKKYRRILSQRNAALKRRAGGAELRPWTDALVVAAEAVDAARRRYVADLSPRAAACAGVLLGRSLELRYRPGWRDGTSFAEALAAAESRDRQLGTTEVGPHRADLVLELDSRRVEDEASRGQQKLTAAALVLAQVAIGGREGGPSNVLLVDDPAAELDSAALERLLGLLAETPAQLVLTGLSERQLAPQPGFPVFHVERGEVRALY